MAIKNEKHSDANMSLFWFRSDLRIASNEALAAAINSDKLLHLLYILDEDLGVAPGKATAWWLHHSLADLSQRIADRGGKLILRRGKTADVFADLIKDLPSFDLYYNADFAPQYREMDKAVTHALEAAGYTANRFCDRLVVPGSLKTQAGGWYKVFTPYYKALLNELQLRPQPFAPEAFELPQQELASDHLEDWGLLPTKPNWASGFGDEWTPGETGAQERLMDFVQDTIAGYKSGRDFPIKEAVSRLSPHLRFGELSLNSVWQAAEFYAEDKAAPFTRQLVWKEFSTELLYQFPKLPREAFKPEYDRMPWQKDPKGLKAWQKGMTGYPLIDAGMRELWHSGYMHNRVRMVVASFLIKDLLIDWREGLKWFDETLVDADDANNAASWQWVAGSGADAAPYFRIFNPVRQSEKFDPKGEYIRKWVPELADLTKDEIHAPWEVPEMDLRMKGVVLGDTYPKPIVDHAEARRRALKALEVTKEEA
ncbi:MAG: deoxyribodipyrimidine photo-lyase [Sneathiella sp.]|nr:deoxyribodipyrimidine photo-lyase [Sneathiella sp.]